MHAAGFPRAASISPNLLVPPHTVSTNADLLRAVTDDPGVAAHLSAIVTTDQRGGRGRLDRQWSMPPGSGLAISVLLRLDGLSPAVLGWVPLLAGVAMATAVRRQLPATAPVSVKWPNDVLVGGRKICGVLVQAASPGAVVVGAGVNTEMAAELLPTATATSFRVLGARCDEDLLLADFLAALARASALLLASPDRIDSQLRADVVGACSTIGTPVRVLLPDGGELLGTASGLDEDGRLLVQPQSGPVHAVAAGDVVHVR